MIKFPLNNNNLKLINESGKYTFNPGEIGLYKFENKNIKMEFISEKNNFEIFYYIDYISEKNFNNSDNLLLSPEIFNKKEFTSNKINFEINTDLDIEKINSENNNIQLYLIFSFDSKVTVNNSDSNGGINMIIIGIITGVSILVIVAIIVALYIFLYKKKHKKILITPLNESGNNEINYNSQATSGNYEENNLYNKPEISDYPNINEIITNDGNKENNCLITESSDISMKNNTELPAPLPK